MPTLIPRPVGFLLLAAAVAGALPAAAQTPETQYDAGSAQTERHDKNSTVTPGGKSIQGAGIGMDQAPKAPPANAKPPGKTSSGGAKNPAELARACYEQLSSAAMKGQNSKSDFKPRGRLICWIAYPEGNAKNVYQYEDGSFLSGAWYTQSKVAFRGAAQMFADKFNDQKILKQKVTGYYSAPTKWMSDGYGAYMDNLAPAKIPDEVHWKIKISGGYTMEFDHGNSRDCIFSGNGIYTLSGNGHTLNIPANQNSAKPYKGMCTCIRCDCARAEAPL
ncbi:MAG TPA: hypothetical protein DD417_03345 [Elusimicrobia bacterium]|nr:hypothetical protein [Elusimicrobiota bacterium]